MTDSPNDAGPAPVHPAPQAQPPTSAKAIVSLVLGIMSLPSCFCVGVLAILLGIPAIILGIMAKKDVSEGRAGGASSGMAIAGLICGIIGVCLGLLYIVFFIIGMLTSEGPNAGMYTP